MSAKRAAKELSALLNMVKSLSELAEEVDKVGNVESLINRLKAESEVLARQNAETARMIDEAKVDLEKIKDLAAKERDGNEKAILAAAHKANVIQADAKLQADQILAHAKATRDEAAVYLKTAKDNAREEEVKAKRAAFSIEQQARAKAQEAEADTLQAQKALEAVRREVAEEERKLAAVRDKINSLRAQLTA